jgi:hypothetical protein
MYAKCVTDLSVSSLLMLSVAPCDLADAPCGRYYGAYGWELGGGAPRRGVHDAAVGVDLPGELAVVIAHDDQDGEKCGDESHHETQACQPGLVAVRDCRDACC